MKKKIKHVIEIIAIILAVGIAFYGSSFMLNRQLTSNELRVRNFYGEKENSLDMVVLGSSSVYTSISSPLIWNDHGITSYVLATSGAPMGVMKSMLIEVEKHQNPKLIVIDINGAMYNDKTESKEGSLRFWIDNMPFSQNKIDTINELIPEDERMSYYLPIIKYHNNWEKLKSCMNMARLEFDTRYKHQNLSISGISGKARTTKRKKTIDMKNFNEKDKMDKLSEKHLYNLLDYLKEKNYTNVVFVNMPRYYDKKMLPQKRKINTALEIVKKYGFKTYDFDREVDKIGLDKNKDYYDVTHVNIYGQKKMTNYFMNRLKKDFFDKDIKHDDETNKKWNQEYKTYEKAVKWIDEKIKSKEKIVYDIRKFPEILN